MTAFSTLEVLVRESGSARAAAELAKLKREALDTGRAVEKAGQQAARSTAGFNRAAQGATDAARGFDRAKSASAEFNDELLKFGRTMASFAALYYTMQNFFGLYDLGLRFNKTIEESRIGLAGLLSSLYVYKDSAGQVASAFSAFNAAQQDATVLQDELRVAALKTQATYEELIFAMQNSLLPATQAGVKFQDLTNFVQRFAQIMQVVQVPMNQVNEEVRSFLQGTMQPRMTRVMPFMAGVGLTNDKIKELVANGKLYEEFMKRTKTIELMAAEGAKTFSTSLSNLYDAFQQIMGIGTKESFEWMKQAFLDLTGYLVTFKQTGDRVKPIFNDVVLNFIEEADKRFKNILESVKQLVLALREFAAQFPTLTAVGLTLADIFVSTTLKVAALTASVGVLLWTSTQLIGVWSKVGAMMKQLVGKGPVIGVVPEVPVPSVKLPAGYFTEKKGVAGISQAAQAKAIERSEAAMLKYNRALTVAELAAEKATTAGTGLVGTLENIAGKSTLAYRGVSLLGGALSAVGSWVAMLGLEALVKYLAEFEYKGKKIKFILEDWFNDKVTANLAKVGIDLPKIIEYIDRLREKQQKYASEMKEGGPVAAIVNFVGALYDLGVAVKMISDSLDEQLFGGLIDAVEGGLFSKLGSELGTFISSLKEMANILSKDMTGKTLGEMWTEFLSIGESTLSSLLDYFSSFVGKASTKLQELFPILSFILNPPLNPVGKPVADEITDSLADAWEQASNDARSKTSQAVSDIKAMFPFSVQMFIDMIPRLGEGQGVLGDMASWARNKLGMSEGRMKELTGQQEGVPVAYKIFQKGSESDYYFKGGFGKTVEQPLPSPMKPEQYIARIVGTRPSFLDTQMPQLTKTPGPIGGGGGKGGGGGGREDAEARRLLSIYDTLNKDIARLSEGRLSEINALEEKTNNQILNRTEVRVVTEAELIELNAKRAALQRKKAEEDYGIWAGKISGDVTKEWQAAAQKQYQDWKGFKDLELLILEDYNRKVAEYNEKQIQAVSEGQKNYLTALKETTPLLSNQLEIQGLQLDKDHERNMAKIELQRLEKQIGEKTAETLKTLEQETYELQKQTLERQKWMTQGTLGGVKQWAWERVGEAEQRPAREMIGLMGDAEKILGDSLFNGIKNALQGTKTDWLQVGQDMALEFIQKFTNSMTSYLFDQLAMYLSQIFGFEMNNLQTSTASAAKILAMGGAEAGAELVKAAVTAAEILQMGASGKMGGGGIGGRLIEMITGTMGAMMNAPFSGFSGLDWNIGASALGNIFSRGTIIPFAAGGVIGGKTYTPMALMGEAGPEAVMPLSRTSDGRLGVIASGMGSAAAPVNVVVNNNTGVQAQADVKMSEGQLEITLSKIVSKNIARGGDIHRQISRSFNVGNKTQRR